MWRLCPEGLGHVIGHVLLVCLLIVGLLAWFAISTNGLNRRQVVNFAECQQRYGDDVPCVTEDGRTFAEPQFEHFLELFEDCEEVYGYYEGNEGLCFDQTTRSLYSKPVDESVSSFEECAKATNFMILDTNPRSCRDDKTGEIFLSNE